MCGIVSIVDSQERVDAAMIDAMRRSIVHRGPDASGTVVRHNESFSVGLGAQRLSIVDLSPAGTMPMASEDGGVWVVYNGEIYNHAELRADLERRGCRYRSRTDTETLLHAYREWGLGCFERFNGMFACVIYDERQRRVVIARDRAGIKPLYYAQRDGKLSCASELKALLSSGLVARELDPAAADVFLALGYVPAPHALVRGVRKLEAGYYGVFEHGKLHLQPFWRPSAASIRATSWSQTVTETRDALTSAIRRQMMSDVPVGVMLSGGLDSSIVAAVAQAESREPLHTFAIGFESGGASLEPKYNHDRDHARRVASWLGTVHHEVSAADGSELGPQLRTLFAQLDEPVWEPSFLSIYLLSRLAREHGVKVLLSGDGSDELFGGYPWHPALLRLERLERLRGLDSVIALLAQLPSATTLGAKARDLRRKYGSSDIEKYHVQYGVFDSNTRSRLFGRPATADPLDVLLAPLLHSLSGAPLAARFAAAELRLWVGEHFNQRLDRMTMAASVEGRVPFQDNAVVDLALSMPMEYKLRGGKGKAPLRAAFAGRVPDFVVQRPKRPFAAPATTWMHGSLRPMILDALAPESLDRLGVIDPVVAGEVSSLLRAGLPVRQEQIWSLFGLVLWYDQLPSAPVGTDGWRTASAPLVAS